MSRSPLPPSAGGRRPKFAAWVSPFTMLADLRRKAAETLQALRQAETSNRAKTQFLANMSHELRTPLNGVVGMLELMRLSGVSSTQQNYIEQANRSAQSLLRMVGDVLDLSEM